MIADVGQGALEEVDYVKLGAGEGRQLRLADVRGIQPFDSSRRGAGQPDPADLRVPPRQGLLDHGRLHRPRPQAAIAAWPLPLRDLCAGEIRSLVPRLGGATGDRALGLSVERPTSFGEGRDGKIYVASGSGPVFRFKQR